MNPDILVRYAANRLRVVRQLRYSLHNENAIDLVFFLNGIPVATVELKSDFTQSVDDAMDQYRYDREPRPKGQGSAEPLLSFPNGALVHFAVSHMKARMTTKLEGPSTTFLPFNRGNQGAAGNPPSPQPLSRQGRGALSTSFSSEVDEGQSVPLSPRGRGARGEGAHYGHRTAYLWEEVWARESWLEILGRYLVAHKDSKKQLKKIIFPRFHQLDATRKLLAAVLEEVPGGKYLIQHSAGSGETEQLIAFTKKAKEVGASILLITAKADSTIGDMADAVFQIGRSDQYGKVIGMPMGTTFELSTLSFLEAYISHVIHEKGIPEEVMRTRHANLE